MFELSALVAVGAAALIALLGLAVSVRWLLSSGRLAEARPKVSMFITASLGLAAALVALVSFVAERVPVIWDDGSIFRQRVEPRSDLRSADLTDANLRFANLEESILVDADLREADLTRSNLRFADLSHARADGASLREADLLGADLSGITLRGASLSRARLSRSDLRNARLDGADLSEALLTDAILEGAVLTGSNLHGADLRGTLGLTESQLFAAKVDRESTLFPPDLKFDWDLYERPVTIELASGTVVAEREVLRGTVYAPVEKVWVLIRPLEASVYWVQPSATLQPDGTWASNVYFGTHDAGAGEQFEIIAVADPEGELREGLQLRDLPRTRHSSKVITVVRE